MKLSGIRISKVLTLWIPAVLILGLLALAASCGGGQPADQTQPNAQQPIPDETPDTPDQDQPVDPDPTKPYAVIETDRGEIVIELFLQDTPTTAANFQSLTEQGFYDSLTFHRVEPDFVVQGGDPNGDGSGGPGYNIPDEDSPRKHLRGAVGMAKSDLPDSAGSQFYICLEDSPFLDGGYTVFGQVVEGMDVVDAIQVGDVMNRVYLRESN